MTPAPEPTHLEHGRPVAVLIKPYQRRKDLPPRRWPMPLIRDYAPVNVLIEREDGTRVVRPRRGLRRLDA
ncbi:hypothetical protein Ssi03_50840 [Sphaerisporangium siamense]|uniref:Uncharacterized protein n=1 Tax=Sphaerisporangium siamense TaxID=795645 RepID=A0A7W7D8I5_9ACTN|nr:hypothetical protein [Sphaerisporangium siamense]MBB4702212.1 hypothetical protein [Sphaerisporangium siamense]GII87094.1 hypothetical protein Ssi03_50840 [Sphaerisporangium siamense]